MQFTIVTFLAFAASVSAHCVYRNPAVIAKAVRNDATQSKTCNVQQALANPVTADSTGAFTLAAQSFNAGVDGATAVKTATLDTTGKGQTFSGQVTIVQNGNPNPTASNTLSTIKMSLPAGTKCAGQGGACLVFTTSDGGFTSCNAVIQSGATASSGTTGSTGKGNTATSGQTGNTGSTNGNTGSNKTGNTSTNNTGNTGSNKTGTTSTNNTGNTGSNKTGGKKNNAAARKHHHNKHHKIQTNKKAPRMLRLSKEWIQ